MIKAQLRYQPGFDNYELWIIEKRFDGSRYYMGMQTIEMSIGGLEAKPFIPPYNPNFEASEFAQAILDAAWEVGMRPKGFTDIQNETTAIKEHLGDMRRLVFAHINPYNIKELK